MKRSRGPMTRAAAICIALAATLQAVPAFASPVRDCPLRDRPFSLQSPLMDVLLSRRASAIVRREAGDFSGHPFGAMLKPAAPSMSAIVTLEGIAPALGIKPAQLARIGAAFKTLPVTAQDRIARCARYDGEPVAAPPKNGRRHVLLFEKNVGFRDAPAIEAAHRAFVALADARGWDVVTTEHAGAFTPATLRGIDLVIWNNNSGDLLTLSQRAAFRAWIERGGAYVGVHSASGDPATFWPWYRDTLVGATFVGHPMNPQFQDARIVTETRDPTLSADLPREWTWQDEWYSFAASPRSTGAQVVATLDEKTYSPTSMTGESLAMGDHPIAWTRCIGRGRMFYSAIGHRPEGYADTRYRTMLGNALDWAIARNTCSGAAAR